MEHEEQKDPVAQSTSAHFTTPAVDLSDRDNKENLVVKKVETHDADAFEKVEAEVVKLLKEPQSLVQEPPPGSSISPPGSLLLVFFFLLNFLLFRAKTKKEGSFIRATQETLTLRAPVQRYVFSIVIMGLAGFCQSRNYSTQS